MNNKLEYLEARKAKDLTRKQLARATQNEEKKKEEAARKQLARANFRAKKKTITNTLNSNDKTHSDNVNYDALQFAEALKQDCQFYTCGCCEWEGGLSEMIPRSNVEASIRSSKLKDLYLRLTSDTSSIYTKAFGDAIVQDLDDFGCLKSCNFLCKKCVKSLTGIYYI